MKLQNTVSVDVDLHGVCLRVSSDLGLFTDYLGRVLGPLICASIPSPAIHSRLSWVDGPPPNGQSATFGVDEWDQRPDRDLYVAGRKAWWLRIDDLTSLKLAVDASGECMCLEGRYYFQLGRERGLERLRRWRHRSTMDRQVSRRFSTLAYYLVYYPLLWVLSRSEGWHLLHGAAVADAHGAAVFCGMPGCGKSTLAVAMLADPAFHMLSDNLLLFDRREVLACPEPLLLDDRSRARAGHGADRLRPTGETRVFDRHSYQTDDPVLEPRRPTAVFNVVRARRTELTRLDSRTCIARVLAGNTMAKEVRRSLIMGEVLDVVCERVAPEIRTPLTELLDGVPCFSLSVGENDDLSSVVETHVKPALTGPRG
ncbi:MAG: hypothetical protein ACE5D3_03215 [Candidatus Binatia bacterium]